MALPVEERITKDVVDVLSRINAASDGVDAVVEEMPQGTVVPRGQVFLEVAAGDPREAEVLTTNLDDYEKDYSVAYRYTSSESNDRKPDGLHAEVFALVRRKLMADQKRGGLAIRTFGWNRTGDSAENGTVEGEITFTVHYRTLQDNPFASAFEPQP